LHQNFSKFSSGRIKSALEKIHRKQRVTVGFTFLSEPIILSYSRDVWTHITKPSIYSMFYINWLEIRRCHRHSLFCLTFSKLLDPSHKYYPSAHKYNRPWNSSDYARGAVEEELIQCQKSVYLEQSNQLEFKYISENYKKKRFYYLKESFETKWSVWEFRHLQNSRLPFYFSLILQSGVYHEIHKLKQLRDHLKRRYVTTEIINRTEKNCFRYEVFGANNIYCVLSDCFDS